MRLIPIFLLFLAAFVANCSAAEPISSAKPWNIVFILIDDLGWTDVGCFGSKFYQTPNIDRLAKEGMKFTQAYSACTVCSPTRSAIMTGKYPARTHITDWIAGHNRPFAKMRIPNWTMYLPLEERSMATALKTAGYTSASIGKWHLGNEAYYPEKHGFDLNLAGCFQGQPPSYFSPYGIPTLKDGPVGEYLTDREAEEAAKFIEKNKDRQFYLYLPFHAVHMPLQAKKEVIAKYKARIDPASLQTNATYAALIEGADDGIGTVLRKLDDLKLSDRTVVFFNSDNGGLSGTYLGDKQRTFGPTDNSPLRMGKGSSYEGGVRVPLIVRWPGIVKPGTVCETPVISTDYYPTLLELTGAAPAPGQIIDGESLIPLLTQTGGLKRDTIYWHYPHYHPGGATPYGAIRQGDLKLIEFYEDDRVELYNLKNDIGEKNNLAATMPDKADKLHLKLAAWRLNVGAQMPTPNPDYDPVKDIEPPAAKGKKGKAKNGCEDE